jgi:hypothetical protein
LKGLELCESYFSAFGLPMIAEKFPEHKNRIAAGLVGDGSECFGFDDELSQDHDWGPAFCLWLNQEDYKSIGMDLQKEYQRLPDQYLGFKRLESQWGGGRTGVFEIGQFYKKFIVFDHIPSNLTEWRIIPEEYLATATNGKVFFDNSGEFTAFRNKLKAFYPEDIRLKKIASRCMTLAQYGQYNYPRIIKRREFVAAYYAESQFINHVISMVYLLNREYKPFYKWMHRDVLRLPILGSTVHDLVYKLVAGSEGNAGDQMYRNRIQLMEEASQLIISELKRQGLSDSESDFLLDHGPVVQSRIQDPQIRSLNVWVE